MNASRPDPDSFDQAIDAAIAKHPHITDVDIIKTKHLITIKLQVDENAGQPTKPTAKTPPTSARSLANPTHLSYAALCQHYDLNQGRVQTVAKNRNIPAWEALEQLTGWVWYPRDRVFRQK